MSRYDDADDADVAEQQNPVDDEEDVVVDQTDPEVDDADRWEQATPVPGGDDEDYPEG
ncbi:MAG: hypothetical protein J2P22_02175 [Nocardioides sp.]|nr:hypothetical protein [Nocardioides sp.]